MSASSTGQDRQAQRMKEEEQRDQAGIPNVVLRCLDRKGPLRSVQERSFVLKQIESLKAEEVEQQHLACTACLVGL